MNAEKRATTQLVFALIMATFGCVMITIAFFIPPSAEIHPTVLAAFGEILSFAGAVIGVDYSYKKKQLTHFTDEEDL